MSVGPRTSASYIDRQQVYVALSRAFDAGRTCAEISAATHVPATLIALLSVNDHATWRLAEPDQIAALKRELIDAE